MRFSQWLVALAVFSDVMSRSPIVIFQLFEETAVSIFFVRCGSVYFGGHLPMIQTNLDTDPAGSSETLVNCYRTTRRHVPENSNLHRPTILRESVASVS
jgi:hypothetical protein